MARTEPRTAAARTTHRRPRVAVAASIALAMSLVLLSGCEWRLIAIPGDGPTRYRDEVFAAATVTSGLTFGSAPNQQGQTQTLRLDLYEPTGDAAATRPAIVWVHGGAFKQGERTSPELVDQATVFARRGYVNVSIDYRLTANGCFPTIDAACLNGITDAKHDAQAAVRWLRANAATYRIDVGRIAIAGSSAGAITALNVAYGSDNVGTSGNPGFDSTVRAAVSLSGTRILNQPGAGEPPVLLFHGTADPIVPYSAATAAQAAALNAGLVAELTTWEGGGHVPYVAHRDEILLQEGNFLFHMMALAVP